MFPGRRLFPAVLATLLIAPASAAAQPFEQGGIRALGLGGAFVAVADDASAVWWNPAGLATGPFFNVLLEWQTRGREPAAEPSALERSAVDQSVAGFALATPPLGFSYQRTRYTTVPAAAAGVPPGEPGSVSSLILHQTGVTLLQSITSGLVVGSTLKFVRGIVATGAAQGTTDDLLESASDLIGRATNRFDADLGVHWRAGPLRAGLTVRNLVEPSFSAPDGAEIVLERQARAGVAMALGASTTAALDVDLTEQQEDPAGRRVAIGVEHRPLARLAVRAGLRLTTGESVDQTASVGGSVAVRPSIWVDGFWSRGEFEDVRWGVGGRVVF